MIKLGKMCVWREEGRGGVVSKYQVKTKKTINKLELMFMKQYAPNRCLYIKVAKLRTGVGVQRCHTHKIAVSKYSKSTAGIFKKKERNNNNYEEINK